MYEMQIIRYAFEVGLITFLLKNCEASLSTLEYARIDLGVVTLMGGVYSREECCKYNANIEKREQESGLPWYSDCEVDWNGCRKFARLPQPGEHPSLFFTKDEIPSFVARFTHSELSDKLKLILEATKKSFLKCIENPLSELSEEEKFDPNRQIIDKFLRSNEHQYVNILGAYVYGIIFDDDELAHCAKKAALFYSKLILKSREIALQDDKDGVLVGEPYLVWLVNRWELKTAWLLGGAPFALMYDLVYNDLTIEEKNLMRAAITTAIQGRRSWGMGWPSRRIQSNWSAYNGDLLTMCAVVEGEENCDPGVYPLFSDLMVHYMDYGFYDSGHPVEDCYALNLGLREGSICALSMARRGHNVFNHPHYKKIWTNWFPHALEPQDNGKVYGGSSGSSFVYPTSLIIAKYMFPKDKTINFVYQRFMSEQGRTLSKVLKLQSRLAALVFAIPALTSDLVELEVPESINQSLLFVCRDRGKVVMRSDWTKNAMWFTVDARPDCFLIGHDTCSRGAFVLNADGRAWSFCPEWKYFKESSDYSLPCIDGTGQLDKAPFVKLQDVRQGRLKSVFVSADLTYPYNWTWTTWADEDEDLADCGYEQEPNDPRSFGYNVWWAPSKLHGERHVAFKGLYQWRKKFASVQQVFRSSLFVPTTNSFVIIADDVKKDEETHQYSWAMTTPDDVELLSYVNGDAVLTEVGGCGRRFLVRNLSHDTVKMDCSFRQIPKLQGSGNCEDKARQLIFYCHAREAHFRFLLYSLPAPQSKELRTSWEPSSEVLEVLDEQTQEVIRVGFKQEQGKACSIAVL